MKVSEETETTVKTRGFDATYYYKTAPFELKGKSTPGSDQWTMTGEGMRSGIIKRIQFPNMSCVPYGELKDKQKGSLTLDGLKMTLQAQNVSVAGDVGMRCTVPRGGQGWSQSMRPVGESGGGEVFKDARVKFVSDFVTDMATSPAGKALASGGMSVSGFSTTKVELECPAK